MQMKFEVLNRWTGEVQFTAEIDADDSTPRSIRLRLAVQWALKNHSDLRGSNLSGSNLSCSDLSGSNLSGSNLSCSDLSGSNLSGSNLSGSDLRGSNLSGSNLSGSNLSGSNLSGSNLRAFKADLFFTLTRLTPDQREKEVPHLIDALRAGRIDGQSYGEGRECACLVGTLANAGGRSVDQFEGHSANNPAEQWFTMIRPGDTPDKDTGGGFAARIALEWVLEWCACNGVAVPVLPDAVDAADPTTPF
jgi:hypothetical protein